MDWEAPADAWYVWLGVTVISLAIGGVVLGLPTGPPPDANQAANTIDRVSGSTEDASGRYDHDADLVKIDGATIELQNDDGVDRATLRYGEVVPVRDDQRLANLTRGASFEDEYRDEFETDLPWDGLIDLTLLSATEDERAVEALLEDADEAYENNTGEWYGAEGELVVRTVSVNAYWFDRWATEEPDGTYVEVEMNDEAGIRSDRPEAVTVSYSVSEETDLEIELLDDHGHELDSASGRVDGTGEVDLEVPGSFLGTTWEAYPVEVRATAGTHEGEATLEHGDDEAVLIEHAEYPTNDVVADNFDWLSYDSEREEYYATFVVA